MSIIIVGGNDRMVCNYKNICKKHNCKAKVFTQMPGDFKSRIGCPDLVILFTSTVSHKMVSNVLQETTRQKTKVVRSHSSSSSALNNILAEHCYC